MKQCEMCPNEADLCWTTPAFEALTPAGVLLLQKMPAAALAQRTYACVACFETRATALGEEAGRERRRRLQKPS